MKMLARLECLLSEGLGFLLGIALLVAGMTVADH